MKSISYTEARSNLAKTMEQVCDDHASVAITRKGGGSVAMMPMADYQALEETAWKDYLYWQKKDKKILKRINLFMRDPFEGMGKPEPLKHALSGYWPRRINDEHRAGHKIHRDSLLLVQLRFHY